MYFEKISWHGSDLKTVNCWCHFIKYQHIDYLHKIILVTSIISYHISCSLKQLFSLSLGVVLGRDGGLIQNQYWQFFFGLGGPIGKGTQWLPWIHISDLAGLIHFSIFNDHVRGVLNAVAPESVTNEQFAKAFGAALGRPAILPTPSLMMKLAFGSERSVVILEGQKVIPKRTLEMGFQFKYPTIKKALEQCCKWFIYTIYCLWDCVLINFIIINIVKLNGIWYILSMYCVAMLFEINILNLLLDTLTCKLGPTLWKNSKYSWTSICRCNLCPNHLF